MLFRSEMVGLIIQAIIDEIKSNPEMDKNKKEDSCQPDCCGGCDKSNTNQEAAFDTEFDKLISKKKSFSTF